jgi:hypothetical protein
MAGHPTDKWLAPRPPQRKPGGERQPPRARISDLHGPSARSCARGGHLQVSPAGETTGTTTREDGNSTPACRNRDPFVPHATFGVTRWPGFRISATLVLTRVKRASGPVDDLMPVCRHPQFKPRMAGIVLRGRPHPGPVRAAIGTDTDQTKRLQTLTELGRRMVLKQHKRRPVSASQVRPDPPGRFSDGGDAAAGLSDNSQVTRSSGRSGPGAQVPDPKAVGRTASRSPVTRWPGFRTSSPRCCSCYGQLLHIQASESGGEPPGRWWGRPPK